MADPSLDAILESAARLQALVPDAVVVGGTAAAFHAHHRDTLDHDHVLRDLNERFDAVLDALSREPDWVFNRATPGKIILGSLGDIEVGVRQLIRARPLETEEVTLASGSLVRVPTLAETLRIKAFLIVRRNQVRDFLDVAALSSRMGMSEAASVLSKIDDYYADQTSPDEDRVATQVARQLGAPNPRDQRTLNDLAHYKGLAPQWQQWDSVVAQCKVVASAMVAAQE